MEITIDKYNDDIYVLRDDLLPGGTKSVILPHIISTTVKEYVYATPVYGGFQIALSRYCEQVGVKATIICAQRQKLHENTLTCIKHGAQIIQVPHGYLSVVEKNAAIYCRETGATKLHFGAKTPENIEILASRVRAVIQQLGFEPAKIVCALGSGTLFEAIIKGTETAQVTGISVGATYNNHHPDRAAIIKYHKGFEKVSKCAAPFPSMPNYDLKAWEYCLKYHEPGTSTLFWNVL